MKEVVITGLSFNVIMNGPRVRYRRTSASNMNVNMNMNMKNMNKLNLRYIDIRHDFGDEFAHLAWRADLEQVESPNMVSRVYLSPIEKR